MLMKSIDDLFNDTFTDPGLKSKLKNNLEETLRLGGYHLDEKEMEMVRQFMTREWTDFPVQQMEVRIAASCSQEVCGYYSYAESCYTYVYSCANTASTVCSIYGCSNMFYYQEVCGYYVSSCAQAYYVNTCAIAACCLV